MKIHTHTGKNYAINLRWANAANIDAEEFIELTERYTDYGIRISDENKRVGFGLVEDEDSRDLAESFDELYSLADSAREYSSNAIFIAKLRVDSSHLIWGCLVSDGVPVIDFADQSVDLALSPILNRLSELGGDDLLKVQNLSIIVDEELNDETDESVVYQKIITKRDFRVRKLLGGELYTCEGKRLSNIKYRENKILSGNGIKAVALLLILILFAGLLANYLGSSSDPYANLDFGDQANYIEDNVDYTGDIEEDISLYLLGASPDWLEKAINEWETWPARPLPYKKDAGSCRISNKGINCEIKYSNDGSSISAGHAYKNLMKKAKSLVASVDASNLSVEYDLRTENKKYGIDSLSDLANLDDVIILVNRMTVSGKYEIAVSAIKVVTIAGKQDYFSSLSDSEKDLMTVGQAAFQISGKGRTRLFDALNDLSEIGIFKTSEVKFEGLFPIRWVVEGSFVIKDKDNVKN